MPAKSQQVLWSLPRSDYLYNLLKPRLDRLTEMATPGPTPEPDLPATPATLNQPAATGGKPNYSQAASGPVAQPLRIAICLRWCSGPVAYPQPPESPQPQGSLPQPEPPTRDRQHAATAAPAMPPMPVANASSQLSKP